MENMENSTAESIISKSSFTDEVKSFYTGDFKDILMTFFKNPIDGILTIFQNPSAKSYSHALILYVSVAILYVIGAVLLAGDMRSYMTVSSYIQIALFPVFTMLAITVLSFAVKSVTGNINFKDELLTGALCGIPLGLLIPGMLIAKVLGTDNVLTLLMNPSSGGIIVVCSFYTSF